METIERKAEEVAHNSNNLNILKKFSEIVESKYLAQVEQDYIALSPGLILRDKWIDKSEISINPIIHGTNSI
ncbi:hypothetical protein [Scytonema sp. NUACC26]|uniref:hypothetical protein n=1 Tax=Scytonema sp. NUACC26 TaxID=3140176 RepID=UPI0038B29BDA